LELAHGHFLHKTGSRRAANAALRVAHELFDGLGAQPFSERCDVELAACGVRTRLQGADDDYGLTAREQVVARLVASGKSNREVAAELYLSSKAIEYQLANIFTKLGIRSRHELASRMAGHAVETMPAPRQDALAGTDPR
jgi:DNA-binding NarL/FixJ family response regulator